MRSTSILGIAVKVYEFREILGWSIFDEICPIVAKQLGLIFLDRIPLYRLSIAIKLFK